MKLAAYFELTGRQRGEFAAAIGVTGGWITQLCDGTKQPSLRLTELIFKETAGAVTANDFMRHDREEAAE